MFNLQCINNAFHHFVKIIIYPSSWEWVNERGLLFLFYFILFYFILFYFILFYFIYIYLFLIETEHKWGRGRERRRHRIQSRLQAPSCQHRAQRGAWTHKPWDHDLNQSCMLNWLSHQGAPRGLLFLKDLFCAHVLWDLHMLFYFIFTKKKYVKYYTNFQMKKQRYHSLAPIRCLDPQVVF